nr:hypothetical protein [Microbacterium paraoxydans]
MQTVRTVAEEAICDGPRREAAEQHDHPGEHDEQQCDHDDGEPQGEISRRHQPQAVEHHRRRDPSTDRLLTGILSLRRERLPHRVGDQSEVDQRPDRERRSRGREKGALRGEGSVLQVVDGCPAESSRSDSGRDQHERRSRDDQRLTTDTLRA